jgi:hypothetical protein
VFWFWNGAIHHFWADIGCRNDSKSRADSRIERAGEASRRASWEEIASSTPEIVILAPCGYDLAQTIEQGRELLLNSPLRDLGAQVWATNATALFSRCTPATIRGVEVVAGILAQISMFRQMKRRRIG